MLLTVLCFLILFFSFIYFIILNNNIKYVRASIPTPRRFRLIQKIPGPKGIPFFGNLFLLLKVKHDDLFYWGFDYFKKFPGILKIWICGISDVFLENADDIQVLLNSIDHLPKGLEYFILRPWLEYGLLTSEGDKWHSRRKMLTPAFHFKILEDNLSIFNQSSKELCEEFTINQNKELILDDYVSICTLKIIMRAAMGLDLKELQKEGTKYVEEIKTVTEIVAQRLVSPHLYSNFLFNMTNSGRRFNKAVGYLQEFSNNVIRQRKRNLTDRVENKDKVSSSGKIRKAFLDLMLEYKIKNPGSLTDNGIREEVDTFMFEGYDTTSVALNYIFYNLAKYQDVQEKVYQELCDIFSDSDRDVTMNDLQRMIYLEKVIKESLRLYPSVPSVTRLLDKDLTLNNGTIIPAWTNVLILTFLLHRNEKYWENAEIFDPERFSEDNMKGRHPYSYIPFSAGPRNCIGQKFAMMELKTAVTNVVRKLKILPVTKDEDFKLVVFTVLRSKPPIKCKFIPRNLK